MRTALVTISLAACLAACGGGGGDDPVPSPPSADELFAGGYALSWVGGYQLFGSFGWTAWGDATADGAGTYAHTVTANELGRLSFTTTSPDRSYTIASDRSVRWRPGSTSEWRGGVSADGAVLGKSMYADDRRPVMGIYLRRGRGIGPTDLMGDYHYAAYGFTLPAVDYESRWGRATFDGAGSGSVRWKANTDGAIPVPWVLESCDYAVAVDGTTTLDVELGNAYLGGVLEDGELAVFSGGTADDMTSYLWVLVAESTDATAARLDGTYFVVGIELDRSTQSPVTRTCSGTVRADGAGGLEPTLVVKQEEDPPSSHSPLWSGYTVAADGALEVTTPEGDLWVGGVSPSGRYAVFTGDTARGGEPVLFFLYR